ncbi:AraC family transcriptional regulator [Motilimonas eburnea]|uniref:AraC family transcriptional regulator n=1 Tax=Motilimonas eburnea TaxID=1737488 RepID=UPI001E518A58|nr:AraC family transcriptional regulator [Motilimonas eburnea]MCE2570255.1 AraC family transcriptional regulator [Motilimonas eburnea]
MSKPVYQIDQPLNLPKPAQIITLPSYMDSHAHQYMQLVIGLKGQAEFEVSGKANVLGPGQGCLVSAMSPHAFGALVSQSDILVLNLADTAQLSPAIVSVLEHFDKPSPYFQLDHAIQHLIKLLVNEMRVSPDDLVLSRACQDTIVALLQRHVVNNEQRVRPNAKLSTNSRFDMGVIDRYIEQHIANKISMGQLAASVYLAQSQFYSLFKQQMGVTPHQYVLSKRIDLAQKLIQQGGFNLSQVAELTGFSNQSTFTHTFSRTLGLSPSRYKKQIGSA